MTRAVSRRRLLAISGSLITRSSQRAGAAVGAPSMRQDRLTRQEEGRITFAVLDTHWNRIQPFVEQYAVARGVQVDPRALEYDELYRHVSLALTQRAETFDVVSLSDTWIPQFAPFVTTMPPNDEQQAGLAPVADAAARYPLDANPCGLPWVGDVQFFAAWPGWLTAEGLQTPETWEHVLDGASMIAAGLDEETSRAGFAISTLSSRDLVNSFLPILRGFGKELIDPESSVPQLDTPEAIAAMQIFEQLILLSPNESPATGELTNAERFSLGDIAMMSNYWATDWLSASAGVEPITDDLLATLQPAESEIERTCLPNIWVAGIPQGSLMSAEAQAFVDWLVLASTQEGFAAVGLPPARTDLVLGGELRGLEIPLASVAQLLAQSRIAPRSPYYPQLSRLLGDALARLLAGDLSGSEALREANVAMREFLSREGVLLS